MQVLVWRSLATFTTNLSPFKYLGRLTKSFLLPNQILSSCDSRSRVFHTMKWNKTQASPPFVSFLWYEQVNRLSPSHEHLPHILLLILSRYVGKVISVKSPLNLYTPLPPSRQTLLSHSSLPSQFLSLSPIPVPLGLLGWIWLGQLPMKLNLKTHSIGDLF